MTYYIPRDRRNELPAIHVPSTAEPRRSRPRSEPAWDKFINQDAYLSAHRGQYAERGGVMMPMSYHRFQLRAGAVAQRRRRAEQAQMRIDVPTSESLLRHGWGSGRRS